MSIKSTKKHDIHNGLSNAQRRTPNMPNMRTLEAYGLQQCLEPNHWLIEHPCLPTCSPLLEYGQLNQMEKQASIVLYESHLLRGEH